MAKLYFFISSDRISAMFLKRCVFLIMFVLLISVSAVAAQMVLASNEDVWGSWECNGDDGFYLDINFETITYTEKKTGRYIVFPVISQYLVKGDYRLTLWEALKIGAPTAQTMPVNEIDTKLYNNILFWQNYSGIKDPEYGYIFFDRYDLCLVKQNSKPDDFFILNQEKEIDYLDLESFRLFDDVHMFPIIHYEPSEAAFRRISTVAPFKAIFEKWYGKLHEPSPEGYWQESRTGNGSFYLDIDTTTITYTDANSGEYVVYPYEQVSEYTSDGYLVTALNLFPATAQTMQRIQSGNGFLGMLQSHSETGEYIYYTSTEDNKNMIFCWVGRKTDAGSYITYTSIFDEKEKPLPPVEQEVWEEVETVDDADIDETRSFADTDRVDVPKINVLKNISTKFLEWLKTVGGRFSELKTYLSNLAPKTLIIFLIISYFITVNIVAFILYRVDKYIAELNGDHKFKGKQIRRIRESVLIFVAVIGGSVGADLGMILCHHKTEKEEFKDLLKLPLIHLLLGILIWIGLKL